MGKARLLTEGEVALARRVFKSAIACDRVRVRAGSLLTLTGQAVAPFGHLHFPRSRCLPDFSRAEPVDQVWFIHEMAHVWQHQQGLCVWCHGVCLALKGGYAGRAPAYAYDPVRDHGKALCEFNMEQQADLIAHHFDACCLAGPPRRLHEHRVRQLPFYEAVLADFLRDPTAAGLLPKTTSVPCDG